MVEPPTPTPLLLTPLNILRQREREEGWGGAGRRTQDAGSYTVHWVTEVSVDLMSGLSVVGGYRAPSESGEASVQELRKPHL